MKTKFFLLLIFLFSSFFYACGEDSGGSIGNSSSDASSDTASNTTEGDTSEPEDTEGADTAPDTAEPPSLCGNGALDPGETCDDGNAETEQCAYGERSCVVCADDCDEQPGVPSFCGDGLLQDGEICDDGNSTDDDNCSNLCAIPACGDGILQAPEECDDGNTENEDTCLNTCMEAVCGDGALFDSEEECDDGNLLTEVCSYGQETCTVCAGDCSEQLGALVGYCGDGFLNGPESCDDGNTITEACQYGEPTCTVCDEGCEEQNLVGEFCGDSILNGSEACDDGNTNDADDCKNNCTTAACGDGISGPGEECDDANTIDTDSCLTTCQLAACGDGFFQQGTEGCDDGNVITEACPYGEESCTVCSATCISEPGVLTGYCSDSLINGLENCDDGNSVTELCIYGEESCLVCNNSCTLELGALEGFCGDGLVNGPEECDNSGIDNELCDADCTFAICGDGNINAVANEECDDSGESGACDIDCTFPICGDGVQNLTAGEACDDGNTSNNDGCLVSCVLASCGDSFTNAEVEDCDAGGVDTATCDSDCTTALCNDGYINALAGEICDDGNTSNSDDCLADCTFASCGDAFTQIGVEDCDSAGIDTVDCNFDCTTAICGDSYLNAEAGEMCDTLELAGTACTDLPFNSGDLACADTCKFDVSGCKTQFLDLDTSPYVTCGIELDRSILCWGDGGLEVVGAMNIPPIGEFSKISGSINHFCAKAMDGTLHCWGKDNRIASPPGAFNEFDTGYYHSCGVSSSTKKAKCWGDPAFPLALAVPNDLFKDIAVGKQFSCGLHFDGTVLCWGESIPNMDSLGLNITKIIADGDELCAISDSDIRCAKNSIGQSWVFKDVAIFSSYTMIVIHEILGSIENIGDTYITPVSSFTNISVSGPSPSSWNLYAWGGGEHAKYWNRGVEVPSNIPGAYITQLDLSSDGICRLHIDASAECILDAPKIFSDAQFLQITLGSNFGCALKYDQSILCWGSNLYGQSNYPLGSFYEIDAAYDHACVLDLSGNILCWGAEGASNYGQADTTGLPSMEKLAMGRRHSCGIKVGGELICWGDNTFSQLDHPLGNFTNVAAGAFHSCGINEAKQIQCWGIDYEERLNAPSGQFVSISASAVSTCALNTLGEIKCWGDSSSPYDYITNPPSTTGIKEMALGAGFGCFLHPNGAMECWGKVTRKR